MTAAAFTSEYVAGFPRTVIYARHCGIPDPENAAQQAWADAWEHLQQYEGREGAAFKTWLHAILVNEVREYWRRSVNRLTEYVAEYPVLASPPPKERDRLGPILAQLRAGDRALLIAHYEREQPPNQLAAEAGISLGAMKSRLHRSLLAARAAA
jgi:RNA polymerase sigma factor (sigma-70 family)